jgi:hypothetical protein
MGNRIINPADRTDTAKTDIGNFRGKAHEGDDQSLLDLAALRRKDEIGEPLRADQPRPRRPRRRAAGLAKRPMAPRGANAGGDRATPSGTSAASCGEEPPARTELTAECRYVEERLGESPPEALPALTNAERADLEAQHRERQAYWVSVHEQLLLDAQACARAMMHSPMLGDPTEPKSFSDVVSKSLDNYRSGTALMDHLGAMRLLDPATTGMLLAIRRGLIEETGATTIGEMVLIDMALTAFANAMRIQSMIGNTCLLIEAEMFGQPSLRAKWKQIHGGAADIRGLSVDEHVARLREQLMPLIERFHNLGRDSIEAIGRMRQAPSTRVERAEVLNIVFVQP